MQTKESADHCSKNLMSSFTVVLYLYDYGGDCSELYYKLATTIWIWNKKSITLIELPILDNPNIMEVGAGAGVKISLFKCFSNKLTQTTSQIWIFPCYARLTVTRQDAFKEISQHNHPGNCVECEVVTDDDADHVDITVAEMIKIRWEPVTMIPLSWWYSPLSQHLSMCHGSPCASR